jgi:hypothetical protein
MEETLLATKERKKRQEKRREEQKFLSNKSGDSKLPPNTHTHTQVPYFVIN